MEQSKNPYQNRLSPNFDEKSIVDIRKSNVSGAGNFMSRRTGAK